MASPAKKKNKPSNTPEKAPPLPKGWECFANRGRCFALKGNADDGPRLESSLSPERILVAPFPAKGSVSTKTPVKTPLKTPPKPSPVPSSKVLPVKDVYVAKPTGKPFRSNSPETPESELTFQARRAFAILQQSSEEEEDIEEPEDICYGCGEEVCVVQQNMDEMWEYISFLKSNEYDDKRARFKLYKHFFLLIHGVGTKGRRIELPKCVVDAVQHQFPAGEGHYVGFKPGKYDRSDESSHNDEGPDNESDDEF